MKVCVPPLKSQGIKTKLVPWIMEQIPDRRGRWIEPFLGTGVVGFNSGFKRALFNEINPHIVRFYQGVQSGEITPQTVEIYLREQNDLLRHSDENGYQHYRAVRARFNAEFAPLDFLFLSRAGFNGMMRFSKKGGWNIPFCKKPDRFQQSYRTKIVNQVKALTKLFRPGWSFTSRNFLDAIAEAKSEDVIYADPPYFGRYTDYFNDWKEVHEQQLAEALANTPARFILSTWHHNDYRSNPSVEKYWSKFNILTKDHFYHAGAKETNRKSVVEALVLNFTPPTTTEPPSLPQMELLGDF